MMTWLCRYTLSVKRPTADDVIVSLHTLCEAPYSRWWRDCVATHSLWSVLQQMTWLCHYTLSVKRPTADDDVIVSLHTLCEASYSRWWHDCVATHSLWSALQQMMTWLCHYTLSVKRPTADDNVIVSLHTLCEAPYSRWWDCVTTHSLWSALQQMITWLCRYTLSVKRRTADDDMIVSLHTLCEAPYSSWRDCVATHSLWSAVQQMMTWLCRYTLSVKRPTAADVIVSLHTLCEAPYSRWWHDCVATHSLWSALQQMMTWLCHYTLSVKRPTADDNVIVSLHTLCEAPYSRWWDCVTTHSLWSALQQMMTWLCRYTLSVKRPTADDNVIVSLHTLCEAPYSRW